MKKTLKVLVVITAIVCGSGIAGAWLTGTQLEGAVQSMVHETNKKLEVGRAAFNILAWLELVSFEQGIFSSTARYRVKYKDPSSVTHTAPLEFIVVDRIEHGPFPWTRVKNLNLFPVIATSNLSLEKTPSTELLFTGEKSQFPLQGHIVYGYSGSTRGQVDLLPIDISHEQLSLSSSGLSVTFKETGDGKKISVLSRADDFNLRLIDNKKTPLDIQLKNFNLSIDLNKTAYDYYVGSRAITLGEGKISGWGSQAQFGVKGLELKSVSKANGELMEAQDVYRVEDFLLNGKLVASVNMSIAVRDINIPATLSMFSILDAFRQNTQRRPGTPINYDPLYQLKAAAEKYADSKPYAELDNLTIKTANGESHFSFALGINKPSGRAGGFADQIRHTISSVYVDLKLSKPMLADLLSVQAQLVGTTAPEDIPQLAKLGSEMIALKAVETGLAKIEGNTVMASLVYSAGQVDLNDQKMSVEDFFSVLSPLWDGVSQ